MVSDNTYKQEGTPEWYNKYLWNSKLPNWYKELLSSEGFGEPDGTSGPRVQKPEDINNELESTTGVVSDVITNTAIKNVKLPGVGKGYRQSQVKSYSYYNRPIEVDRPIRGRSRKWGDVDDEAKQSIMDQIIETGKAEGLERDDIAYVLAIAHIESGFNPDAAAGTTSAHGLGQFINRTGQAYGLSDANRWSIDEQIRALVEHFKDNKKMAAGKGRDYIYAYHHDGPSLQYGGLGIAKNKVRPLYEMYKGVV